MPSTRIEFRPRPQRGGLRFRHAVAPVYQSSKSDIWIDSSDYLSKAASRLVPRLLLLLLVPAVVIVVVIVGDVITRSSSLLPAGTVFVRNKGDNSVDLHLVERGPPERGVRVPTCRRRRSSMRQCGGTARKKHLVRVVVASHRGRLLVVGREECALCPKTSSLGCDVVEMEGEDSRRLPCMRYGGSTPNLGTHSLRLG
jgi:hypothetical protein